ncbi:MAG: flagellar motor protein MotB [bacterium]|nr:flagellar motor protein MotB [bacterium]
MAGEFVSEEESSAEGCPAWMATFGDMMSLLLCFFVLLLSFANTDAAKFKAMAGSMKEALGVLVPNPGNWDVRSNELIEISPSESKPKIAIEIPVPHDDAMDKDDSDGKGESAAVKKMVGRVDKLIDERSLRGIVEAVPGTSGVTIRVKGTLMFNPASDELRMGSIPILEEIAELVQAFDYNLAVNGHTDDVPIKTARYPSNWELSAARAVAGLRYLISTGKVDPARASASGFAHTRPIAKADTAQARALNRRLEFVFYRGEDPRAGATLNSTDRKLRGISDRAGGSLAP